MTTSFTVIGLVMRLKTTSLTTFGDAVYRTDENYTFTIKQFTNTRHEYNEAYKEGDLVMFGGKFTIDDEEKLMVVVEMARIIEPKISANGEVLGWNPTSIPRSKPFVNIVTSPSGQLVSQDEVHFIKTTSLVYSVFHSNPRHINFEIGYSVHAKWFEYLKDKWNDYANFYIGGFVEGVYSVNEKGEKTKYIQVDAKSIDYDSRNRKSPTSSNSPISSPKSPNAFALRRNKISRTSSSEPAEKEVYQQDKESNINKNSIPKKRQLSDLCDELDQAVIDESNKDEPDQDVTDEPDQDVIDEPIVANKADKKNKKSGRGRGRRK